MGGDSPRTHIFLRDRASRIVKRKDTVKTKRNNPVQQREIIKEFNKKNVNRC